MNFIFAARNKAKQNCQALRSHLKPEIGKPK